MTGFHNTFFNEGNTNQVGHFIGIAAPTVWFGGSESIGETGNWTNELRAPSNDPNYQTDRALGSLAVDFANNLVAAQDFSARANVFGSLANRLQNGIFSGGGKYINIDRT